ARPLGGGGVRASRGPIACRPQWPGGGPPPLPTSRFKGSLVKGTHHPDLPVDQILQGDCIELLATLPEGSIDLIFADPPYNLQLRQELWRPNMTRVDGVDDAWDQFSDFTAYDAFTRARLQACRRVLQPPATSWGIGA